MARILESTPQLRILMALSEARKARHHKDCYCRMFDKIACNAADALWTQKMNRELDQMFAS